MTTMLLLLLACSCHQQPEAAPSRREAAPAPEPEPEPVDELTAVTRALSARDAAPPCAEIEGMASDPVATLTAVLETVQMPPQAPMRAATCLVEGHADAIRDRIVGWMASEEHKGLALIVVQRLDDLPLSVAVAVAEAGLGGPVGAELAEALGSSERPELQELAPL